jgi:hypothetical protein
MSYKLIEKFLRIARRDVFIEGPKGEQAERLIPRLLKRKSNSKEHQNHLAHMDHLHSERLLRMWS